MLFHILSNADIDFLDWKLQWRIYTTKEALPTTRRIELVEKKEFAAAALNLEYETFVGYVAFFNRSVMSLSSTPLNVDIYSFCKSQIAGLIAKKAPIKVFAKYYNFVVVFFLDLTSKFPKHIGINNHAIELVNGQQLLYGPIYSLEPIELETLKVYIEINLANRFIRLSKLLAEAFIFFDRKLN